jgi:hypothetical protein
LETLQIHPPTGYSLALIATKSPHKPEKRRLEKNFRCLLFGGKLKCDMAKAPRTSKRPVEQYDHKAETRVNNPPVGFVDAKSDAVEGKKTYGYDPHLDPTLVWAGKAERTSFEIATVSLHVHERIDPRSIIEAIRKKNGSDYEQLSLFNSKARVNGPFTVEAVPAAMVKSLDEMAGESFGVPALAGGMRDNSNRPEPADARPAEAGTPNRAPADASVARSGTTIRLEEWRSELLRAGIRGKGGQMIRFSRVEPLSGTRWLHADAETKPNDDGADQLREDGENRGRSRD